MVAASTNFFHGSISEVSRRRGYGGGVDALGCARWTEILVLLLPPG